MIFSVFVTASMLASLTTIVNFETMESSRNILYVDDSGYAPYTHIQDAINDANPGDAVYVYNGTYYETIAINKDSINLIGEDKNTTIIDGQESGDALAILENSDYNFVSGFTVKNASHCGIIMHSETAHSGATCNYNTISDCIVTDCGHPGDHGGICIMAERWTCHADYNTVINCVSYNNMAPGLYVGGGEGYAIGNQYINCFSYDNYWGVWFGAGNNVHDNILTACEVYNNVYDGVNLSSCVNNHIYHNNIMSNTQNGFDDGSNIWYNTSTNEGNYWSDYTGNDMDCDGIGDTPYAIAGGSNHDLYPLGYFKNQTFGEEWNYTFGGENRDQGISVQQTTDSGYIIAGYTESFGAGAADVWLIKTDANGNEEWNRTFGGAGGDYGDSILQITDGGYIISGVKGSYGTENDDVWLIKVDINGNEEWNKTFGGEYRETCKTIQKTSNGGYIISGSTKSYGNGDFDIWLIKVDANGNEEWNRTFGGMESDTGNSVQQTTNGGYILTGITWSFGAGAADVWLIKTDVNGNEEWNKTFGGSEEDHGSAVLQTIDDGFIIAGLTGSYGAGNYDTWLIKTDENGMKEWDKTFGSENYEDSYSIQQTLERGFIITGQKGIYGAEVSDALLIKTDANGNKEWEKTFGGVGQDISCFVQQTTDDGYILTGCTNSYGAGDYDVWLIKISCECTTSPETVYVDGNYTYSTPGWQYNHFDVIQDGVDAVAENGTVYVNNGTYYENVVVNKTINLIGEDKNSTIIDGMGNDNTLVINSCQNVLIDNFSITNSSGSWLEGAGIKIFSTGSCDYNTINNCIIRNNDNNGVLLWPLKHQHANYNNILNCEIYENGKSGIELNRQDGPSWTNYNNILNCKIYNNTIYGILLGTIIYGVSNVVSNCEVYNNKNGINFDGDNSCILNTSCHDNIENGIWISSEVNGTIVNCTFINNGKAGINSSYDSDNNLIYHNEFINNTPNAYDLFTDVWYNPTLQEGNYWSDYYGNDVNEDGIGDTAYNISGGNNQDLYPLGIFNKQPIADFTYYPLSPLTYELIYFNDTSYDNDKTIVTWNWEFGDGTMSTEQNPIHQYLDNGIYHVNLTIKDNHDGTKRITKNITVYNREPISDFTFTPENPMIDDSIHFYDTSTDLDGSVSEWYWEFGDGYYSSLQNPIYEYANASIYTVCLTVTDDDGAIHSSCQDITIILSDVNQSLENRGFPIRHTSDGDWGGAQNFTPTIDTITKVDIYLRKMGTPEFDLTIELREDGPQGILIETVIIPKENVPSSWTWLSIDFDDILVGSGSDIFIVLPPAPSGVTTSYGYEWGYALGNQYDGGCFWFTRNNGGLWRDLPTMYEFCFKTYGYS